MQTSNHSSKLVHDRLYCLTPAGSRLAHYLDFVRWQPTLQQDLAFADLPVPEHHDPDREQPLPATWNPNLTPWQDVPPADDDMDDDGYDDDGYDDSEDDEFDGED